MPREDEDLLREYQAMHEENFLSSWLREQVEGNQEERENMNKEVKEEECTSWEREVEGEKERVDTSSKRIFTDRLDSFAMPFVPVLRWSML